MTGTKAAPCGSWKSPITSTLVASGAVRLELQIALDGEDVYWIETRPAEAGRSVLVRCSPEAQIVDVIASPRLGLARILATCLRHSFISFGGFCLWTSSSFVEAFKSSLNTILLPYMHIILYPLRPYYQNGSVLQSHTK